MARKFLRFSMLVLVAYAAHVCTPRPLLAQQSGKVAGGAGEGKQIFATTCAACHGLDGAGGEHGPDISHRREVQGLTDPALQQIVRGGVPGTGMPAFRSLSEAHVKAVVRYLRSLQGQGATAEVSGDPRHGRAIFFGKAGCSQCHMAKGEGGFIASDLSSYASTPSPSDIRDAITDPNRNLDPRKRPVAVTTADGQTLTGVVRNEDNFSVQLQTPDGTLHLFARDELQSIEYQPRSLMPEDYASRLSREELDDLVSYLVSIARGKSKPKVNEE
jgi:putative heme-binding domain-containing protein